MKIESNQRKKVTVVHNYIVESFSYSDWCILGELTGNLDLIKSHPRLLRSMSFGDEDYEYCASEVINKIFEDNPELIETVIDQYDIDVWFEQKDPKRFRKIFGKALTITPDFWEKGYLKAFISHLARNKNQISLLKKRLEGWGISSFVAHKDIEPSREWMLEIERALSTMDVLIAVIEPGFKESDWTDQEIGFALGKNVDIIPLRVGLDPYGLMGKYQGIQAKGKIPEKVAQEVVKVLLRNPNLRDKLLFGISKSMRLLNSQSKIQNVKLIDAWSSISEEQMRNLLENIPLSPKDKEDLIHLIEKYGAFKPIADDNIIPDSDPPF